VTGSATQTPAAVESEVPCSGEAKRSRLLLAEDDSVIRQLLGIMLRHSNFDLDIAEDGRKAVEMWESGEYDLILMDVQMPLLDGLPPPVPSATRNRHEARPYTYCRHDGPFVKER